MAVMFNETRPTIEILRRTADIFERKKGCLSSDQLWGDGPHFSPALVIEGLRQMEQFLRVLKLFALTYESHICKVRKRVRVPRLTPNDLPEELALDILKYDPEVQSIFSYMHSNGESGDYSGITRLVEYAHVCPRFYDAVLFKPPSQWSIIPLEITLPASAIRFIAHRSGGLDLSVDAAIPNSVARQTEMNDSLVSALQYRHRWTNASFDICDNKVLKSLEDQLRQVEFASLHTLKMSGTWNTFYHSWSIPSLRDCTFHNLKLHVTDIISFLCSAPSLTSLALTLRPRASTDHSTTSGQAANLPNLESLYINHDMRRYDGVVKQLFEAILCPSLKSLSLNIVGSHMVPRSMPVSSEYSR